MQGDADDWWNKAVQEKETAELCRNGGKWPQCYHHAGQAVEFALKAIYMRRKGLVALPDECKGASWHSLALICARAEINAEYGGMKSDQALYANWLTVKDWDSNARFPPNGISKQHATDMMVAAFNPMKGVFGWLETIFLKN